MALTSALVTGLSGLAANQADLSVIGNNISNVNTVGFKASQLNFQSQFAQSFSFGSAPDGVTGGTNPVQVGMGTTESSIARDFSTGSLETTGVNSQLAIQGNGFFVLQNSEQTFTRDGTFKLDSDNKLVNANGDYVQGYGVDSNFNVIPGALTDLSIPVGSLTVAQATSSAQFSGNLDANGALPTEASKVTIDQPLYAAGVGSTPSASPPDATSGPGATLLTNVVDATNNPYFSNGDMITFSGARGGRSMAAKTLSVTPTTTLNDYLNFMQGTLGIDAAAGANGSLADAAGVSTVAGPSANSVQVQVVGNAGSANDLVLQPNNLSIQSGGTTTNPFTFTKNQTGDGESVNTSLTTYDSLGNAVNLNLTASLVSSDSTGTTWQWTADTPDNASNGVLPNDLVGSGTLKFNNFGALQTATGTNITIDRSSTGAVPQMNVALDFSNTTALSGSKSVLASTLQNGSAKGTLNNFAIGQDGTIVGTFSNGLTRNLGQVAIATFTNDDGLIDNGGNTFIPGPSSGTPVISTAGSLGAGTITAGALEQSNVDLSGEFVNLISASTGFSAASKVITTGDQLLQNLLQMVQ